MWPRLPITTSSFCAWQTLFLVRFADYRVDARARICKPVVCRYGVVGTMISRLSLLVCSQ